MGSSSSEREIRLQLFLTGVLSALVTAAFMLALRSVTETESLIELFGEAIVQAMPVWLFELGLQTLGGAAKPVLVALIVLGMLLVGGGIAQMHTLAASGLPARQRAFRMSSLAVGLWMPLAVIALIITAIGTTDPLSSSAMTALGGVILLDVIVFVLGLHLLYPLVRQLVIHPGGPSPAERDRPADSGRRRLLASVVVVGLAIASGGYVARFARSIRGGVIGGRRDTLSEPVTPNDAFYLISKNFVDPSIDEGEWELEIVGLVETPVRLSYSDLLGLPQQEQMTTLTCISNEVGGDLISNARWTGVRLADLLSQAGVQPGVADLALYASDGYTESIALGKALEPTTMLVYLMNDEPLPEKHGYPARLIVPGKYGIKNVKWLTRIELVAGDFKGYWQQRDWTDEATIQTMSRFDVPASRAILARESVELGGIAFAGDRGIQQVEISDDGGATWRAVDSLQHVAPLSWSIWRSTWNPPDSGAYSFTVRATDGTGEIQTEARRDPIPDGATGHHSIHLGIT